MDEESDEQAAIHARRSRFPVGEGLAPPANELRKFCGVFSSSDICFPFALIFCLLFCSSAFYIFLLLIFSFYFSFPILLFRFVITFLSAAAWSPFSLFASSSFSSPFCRPFLHLLRRSLRHPFHHPSHIRFLLFSFLRKGGFCPVFPKKCGDENFQNFLQLRFF